MTEIYVIRHVQAEGNLYRMCQGHWDGDVTALGVKQRDALAERFKDVKIDEIWSSDLYRAMFTATALTKYHPMEVHTDERFREIDLGPWETQYFGGLAWEHSEDFHKFVLDQKNFHIEGAEDYEQVGERAVQALTELAESRPGKVLALTTHGVTIRCMLSRLGGIDLNDVKTLPIFNNTGVAHLLYDEGKFTVDYINDFSHLGPDCLVQYRKGRDLRHEFIDPAKHSEYYIHCYAGSWEAAHGSLAGFDPQTYLASAGEHYLADSQAVALMYDRDKAAGILDMDTRRGAHAGYGWISLIYLEPEYRHQGCGIQLLARAIQKYRALGRKSLRLHVAEENGEALEFYRRWGFQELTREPGAGGGHVILMEKKLGGRAYD